MIKLEGLTKRYLVNGRELLALNNVNLHVAQGTIYGVIGESGAGKSSLLRCVNMLERPSSGRVVIAAQELTTMSISELREQRRHIGMIFQHFNLLGSCTVYDNIALPLKFINTGKAAMEKIITPLIELTGLKGKERQYPHQLSGGQKQRVAIARALATNPRVLLCDEATSALDPKTTDSILQLLREINQNTGLTILLITHELEVIKSICHQVALINQGRILEAENVVDFFANPQTQQAKQIVESSLKMHIPANLESEMSEKSSVKKYPIVRIVFRGHLVREAVISMASRQFLVDISILQSNIEFISNSVVGFLLAELRGEMVDVERCMKFFTDKQLDYQVVGYVS